MIEEIKLKCKELDFEGYNIKIKKFDDFDCAYKVYIDGQEIQKIRKLSFDIEAGYKPTVTLEILEG